MPTATNDNDKVLAEIIIHLNLLNTAANPSLTAASAFAADNGDKRIVGRVLQHFGQLKSRLSDQVLTELISRLSPSITGSLAAALGVSASSSSQESAIPNSPLVTLYLALLAASHQWATGRGKEAVDIVGSLLETAQSIQTPAIARLIDGILAKAWSLWLLGQERAGSSTMIPTLMISLRSASLRHQTDTQAVIHNGIMRAYQLNDQWELAAKFVEHAAFPSAASNAQLARHLYYRARLAAMTMDYEGGEGLAQQALRKCPQGKAALGFRQAAQRLTWILSLLRGIIPERAQFVHAQDRPYLRLCAAVRSGNVGLFEQIVNGPDAALFKRHNLLSLILRLHHNVIRMALQRLNRAYQRLPLNDVATLLRLGSAADAECVVMKAIHEGIIKATINHEAGYVETEHLAHPYYTRLPQSQLDERINHSQSLYAHMLKTMRFTANQQSDGHKPQERISEMDLMEEYMEADDDLPF